MFDNDRNGELSKDEIKNVLTVLTEKIISNGDVDDLFDKYDTDGNGSISISELKPMLFDIEHQTNRKKSRFFKPKTKIVGDEVKAAVVEAKEALMILEVIHDDVVALDAVAKEASKAEEELQVASEEANEASKNATETTELANRQEKVVTAIENDEWSVERVFTAFDKDKNGVLDAEELNLALTSLLGREIKEIEQKKFVKRFDSNGDGVLDFEEFKCVSDLAKKSSKPNFLESMFFNKDAANSAATHAARSTVSAMEATVVEEVVEEAGAEAEAEAEA